MSNAAYFPRTALTAGSRLQRIRATLRVDICVMLCICAATLIAGLWTSVLWQLDKSYRDEIDSARRDAIMLSALLQEQATRTLESTDQAIVFLRQRYATMGKHLNLRRELRDELGQDDGKRLYSIVDDKGELVLSNRPFQPQNLAGRDYLSLHRQSASPDLYLSQPTSDRIADPERVSNQWPLLMTRRISSTDGTFKGVVIASIAAADFDALFQKIDAGKNHAIALIGSDGMVQMRAAGAGVIGTEMTRGDMLQAMRQHEHGVLRSTDASTHHEQLLAYHKLENAPLYAFVSLDLEQWLAPYRTTRWQTLLLTALTSLVILLGAAALAAVTSRLAASRQEAALARKARQQFLSGMSHELRTPLNGILGYSEHLLGDFAGTRHGELARNIHDSGLRLLEHVNALLELSALHSDQSEPHLSSEKLSDIIDQAVRLHEKSAAPDDPGIESFVATDVPDQLRCDREKLLRVLGKLLNNASRISTGNTLRLKLDLAGQDLQFSIADHGPALPAAARHPIVEKFPQPDESGAFPAAGAGLELSVAARLVELMGGSICVETTRAGGSTFSFRVPLHDSTEQQKGARIMK